MDTFFILYRNVVLKNTVLKYLRTSPISLDYYVYKEQDQSKLFLKWKKEITSLNGNVKHYDDITLTQEWMVENRLFYLLCDKKSHPVYGSSFSLSFKTVSRLLKYCCDFKLIERLYYLDENAFKHAHRHYYYGRKHGKDTGQKKTAKSLLDFAFLAGNKRVIEFLFGKGFGRPTAYCIEYGGRSVAGVECVRMVLADPRMRFGWPSHQTIKSPVGYGRVEMVEFLNSHFKQQIRLNNDGVLEAFKHNREPMMTYIVTHYRESLVHVNRPIYMAAKNGNIEMVKTLLDITGPHLVREQLVYYAASSGNIELVKYILEKRPLLKRKVTSKALNFPASNGHVAMVRYLIENVVKSPDSKLAITYALKNKHIGIVKALFTHSPELLARDYSFDIFLHAMRTGDAGFVKHLYDSLTKTKKNVTSSYAYPFYRTLIDYCKSTRDLLALIKLFKIDQNDYGLVEYVCHLPGKLEILSILIKDLAFQFSSKAYSISIYRGYLDYACLLEEYCGQCEDSMTTFLIKDFVTLEFMHKNYEFGKETISFPEKWGFSDEFPFKIVVGSTDQETIDICKYCIQHRIEYSPYPFLQHFIRTNNTEMVELLANHSSGLTLLTAQRYLTSKGIAIQQKDSRNTTDILSLLSDVYRPVYFLNFLRTNQLIQQGEIKRFPINYSSFTFYFLRYLFRNFNQTATDTQKETMLTEYLKKRNIIDPMREFCFLYYRMGAKFTSETFATLLKGEVLQIGHKSELTINTSFYRTLHWQTEDGASQDYFLTKIIEANLDKVAIPSLSIEVALFYLIKNFDLGIKLLNCAKSCKKPSITLHRVLQLFNHIMLWKYFWEFVICPEKNSKPYLQYEFIQQTLLPIMETKKFFSVQKAAKCKNCNLFVSRFSLPPCGCAKEFYTLLLQYIITDMVHIIIDNFSIPSVNDDDIENLFSGDIQTLKLGSNLSISVYSDFSSTNVSFKKYNILYNNHLSQTSHLITPLLMPNYNNNDEWCPQTLKGEYYSDMSISKIIYSDLDPLAIPGGVKIRFRNSDASYYRVGFLFNSLSQNINEIVKDCYQEFYQDNLIDKYEKEVI
ncbi:hypothetical protein CYY_005580 [Polysphondylium violaceum]|uniref:Ankyrin repeat-containing protein n=1 Tax=Polysphondylium violaceum TaxID=133409 RepID=A0A8J4US32_9MYCE|nr:hypothetical protein CYY_005580 [Polysphondylium violaceum]